MATLATQLSAVVTNFANVAPKPIYETIMTTKSAHVSSFDVSKVIKPGSILPPFVLPSPTNSQISSTDLLSKSAILITFYRGNWCPFCNLALRDLQKHLEEFEAKGVTLVAISPELPDTSLTTVEKNELKFKVLSDVGNTYARQLGIVWQQPEELRKVLDGFGHDLPKRNGDASYEIPVPTTLLVGQDGVVRNVFVEADWSKRLETTVALEWVDSLAEEKKD